MATTTDTTAAAPAAPARRMSADAMPPGMALGAPGRLSAVEEALVRPGAPLLYRVTEVMGLLGLSRSVVFEQLRDGRLRSVHQGRARRIPATAVLDYVRLLEREAAERASD